MRAAVFDRYGGPEVVRVAEVPRPRAGRGEVIVKVCATTVNSGDVRLRSAVTPRGFGPLVRLAFGVFRPRRRTLGIPLSGVVEEVGAGVTGYAVGDAVCGMVGMRMGAHAEYAAIQARRLVRVPAGVSHDDAAGVLFGGTAALHFLLRKGGVAPGMSVLVNGAAGALGTNAVQLARHFGATVTAVCSGGNVALVRGLGAEHVVDHTVTPVVSLPERFDLVFDAVGNIDLRSGRALLTERGKLLLAVADLWQTIRARRNVVAGPAAESVEDVALLVALVADGSLRVVQGGVFPLEEIVAAHRLASTGHKVGNVIVHP